MADDPIQRTMPLSLEQWQYLWALTNGTGDPVADSTASAIHEQELITTKDSLRLFRRGQHVGGWAWLGRVASETEMLALYTSRRRSCWPGDMCYRTDTGAVMLCVANNGQIVADWLGLVRGEETTTYGRALLIAANAAALGVAVADVAGLAAALDAKQDALTNIASVARLSAVSGGPPLWDGQAIEPNVETVNTQLNADAVIAALHPIAWYSADYGVGRDTAGAVSLWSDRSGNGYDLSQATAAAKPTWTANQRNGLPVLRFDGTDDCLLAAGFPPLNLQNHTVVCVGTQRGMSAGKVFFVLGASGVDVWYNTPRQAALWAGDATYNLAYSGNNAESRFAGTRPAGWQVMGGRCASNSLQATKEDLAYASAVSPAFATASNPGLIVGGSWPLDPLYYGDIDIGELVIFPFALSTVAYGQVIAALRAKWVTPITYPMTTAVPATVGADLTRISTVGLAHFWPLDEWTGAPKVCRVDNANGQLSAGATTMDFGLTPAKRSTGFNGATTSYLASNPTLVVGGGSFSIGTWVNLSVLANSTEYAMLSKWETSRNDREYFLGVLGNKQFSFSMSNNGTSAAHAMTSAATADTRRWRHVVGTYDATTQVMSLYVDGALAATGTCSASRSGTSKFVLGAVHVDTGTTPVIPMTGCLEEAFLWKRALTAADVAALYGNGRGSFWPFNAAQNRGVVVPPSYVAEVMADQPIAFWPMGEAGGNFVDLVAGYALVPGGGGTIDYRASALVGPDYVQPQWVGIKYADCSSTFGQAAPWVGSYSLDAVVTINTAPNNDLAFFAFQGGGLETEVANAQLYWGITSARKLISIWEYGAGSNVSYTPDPVLALGETYHVAFVKDAAAKTLSFYINGRKVARYAYTQEPTGGSAAVGRVGMALDTTSAGETVFGYVALHGRALSPERIRARAIAAGF